MPRRSEDDTLSSASQPLTSLNIGLWESDVEDGYIRGDAVMAHIFGLSPTEAALGISIQRLLSIFHPEDLASDEASRQKVLEEGGLVVWEHRILPAHGIVRWVLTRGQFERSPDGRMRGRGIVIDVTDTHVEGGEKGSSRFLAVPEATVSAAERMANHALALWELKHELSAGAATRLQPLLEVVLLEIGREIASSLPEGRDVGASLLRKAPKLH